jgi:pyridinium-3,5-bisthiocarboxylic acid mononucleotide nickel chelatase
MRVLYLDCSSGISGDMTVGALVDLGVKPSTLEWELSKLDLGDFHMHFDRARRHEIEGVKFGIHEGATHEQCESEEHHEHGHEHQSCESETHREHEHHHEHGDHHSHHHEHEHEEHHSDVHTHAHSHTHSQGRSHREIREMITHSELSPFVREHALSIFRRIAIAEGKIHGQAPEDVTFHEVGALDSIADIVCACVGFEALGVEKVFVSALHDGRGTVECAHGTFPLPAPATLEILSGIPLGQIDEPHELITPTGAAIVAEFGASFGLMPRIRSEKIGYGVGSRDLATRPNVLRAVLGTLAED